MLLVSYRAAESEWHAKQLTTEVAENHRGEMNRRLSEAMKRDAVWMQEHQLHFRNPRTGEMGNFETPISGSFWICQADECVVQFGFGIDKPDRYSVALVGSEIIDFELSYEDCADEKVCLERVGRYLFQWQLKKSDPFWEVKANSNA